MTAATQLLFFVAVVEAHERVLIGMVGCACVCVCLVQMETFLLRFDVVVKRGDVLFLEGVDQRNDVAYLDLQSVNLGVVVLFAQ